MIKRKYHNVLSQCFRGNELVITVNTPKHFSNQGTSQFQSKYANPETLLDERRISEISPTFFRRYQ